MKKITLFANLLLAVVLLTVSCERDDVPKADGTLSFGLFDNDDNTIEGPQAIFYGEAREYVLKSSYVTSMKISEPAGWKAEFYADSQKAIITAPEINDEAADLSGDVKVELGGPNGQTMTYTLGVAVKEPGVVFMITDDVSQTVEFQLDGSLSFRATATNVSQLEITVPEGWSSAYDLESTPITVTVGAPKDENSGATEGSVSILPKSIKGTAGEPVSFNVKAVVTFPKIDFDEAAGRFTALGATMDFPFKTFDYVEQLEVVAGSEVKGWTVTPDIANRKINVTAPAAGADAVGNGTFTLKATSESGHTITTDFSVTIVKDPDGAKGIASADEFEMFGAAVTAGTPLDSYTVDGEVTLLFDIDMTGSVLNTVVGSAEKPFTGVFNGGGKTIFIENNAINSAEWGLFHTVGDGAVVKELKVAGSLTSVLQPDKDKPVAHLVSAVAVYSGAASFRNVTTNVDFTYDAPTYANYHRAISGADYDYTYAATYGSVVARATKPVSGADAYNFDKCVSEGRIYMRNGAFTHVGGIVGRVVADGITINECENRGALDIALRGHGSGTKWGGILGDSDNYASVVTKCVNRGTITTDFANARETLFGLGGIVGAMYGTIKECSNYGDIICDKENYQNRRIGGVVGVAGFHMADKIGGGDGNGVKDFLMEDCRNEGNITHCSQPVGGLIGIIQRCGKGEIVNSINSGTITGLNKFGTANGHQSHTMGGCVGEFDGTRISGCTNSGSITGYNRLHVAGIAGRILAYDGKDTNFKVMEISDCINQGNIDVATGWAATGDNQLCVAGIAVIEKYSVTFTNCSNEGNLTPTMENGDRCRNIYYARANAGTITVTDAPTQAEQDDVTPPKVNPTIMQ